MHALAAAYIIIATVNISCRPANKRLPLQIVKPCEKRGSIEKAKLLFNINTAECNMSPHNTTRIWE